MTGTDNLIRRLAAATEPTPRLPAPQWRMLAWFAASIPYVALVVWAMSPRADLLDKLTEARFVVEQSAALATALFAAMAAFCATVPGLPAWRLLLPLVPLGVWVGSLGSSTAESQDGDSAERLIIR